MSQHKPGWLLVLILTSILTLSTSGALWGTTDSVYFCKCICFESYSIIPLYRPQDPSNPCLSCTKQFCLDQQLDVCRGASKEESDLDTGTGEEGDVRTKCFQRDSLLARAVITSFVVITICLLVGAILKGRISTLKIFRGWNPGRRTLDTSNSPIGWSNVSRMFNTLWTNILQKIRESRGQYDTVSL